MKTLSPADVVQMFVDAGESYGFRSVFEGTFGGKLLHDEEANQFVWLSDEEHDQLQQALGSPSIETVRSILEPDAAVQRMSLPCREPDDLADTA